MGALSLKDWLSVLQGQLAILGAEGLALVQGLDVGEGPCWCDRLDPALIPEAASATLDSASSGWLIGLPIGQPRSRHLFVATTQKLASDDPRLVLGAAVCRLALSLRQEHDSRTALSRQPMHALRNGLNGVAMTAAVLSQSDLPDALVPFALDLQEAVTRCLQALQQLSAVIAPPPPSRWIEPGGPI